MHGAALSLDWALAAARRLAPGGRMLLYTGSAIVDGEDRLEAALRARLPAGCTLRYAELDPDIFGEQLDEPGYRRRRADRRGRGGDRQSGLAGRGYRRRGLDRLHRDSYANS